MQNTKWRLVGATIEYNAEGKVKLYKGKIVYRQIHIQTKKGGMFDNWIRYETRISDFLLRLHFIFDDEVLLKNMEEVKEWINNRTK